MTFSNQPRPWILAVFAVVAFSSRANGQCASGTNAALQFDGSDFALVTGIPAGVLDGFTDFTFEAWFQAAPLSSEVTIFGKGGGSVNVAYSVRLTANGAITVYLNDTLAITGGTNLDDGVWHHVALARTSGSVLALYVDGQLAANGMLAAQINASTNPLAIGAQVNGTSPLSVIRMVGYIDEVRVWSSGRSQSQINASLHTVLQGNETGLVGYWRLNEGAGQTIANAATSTAGTLNGTLGASTTPFTDDPTWSLGTTAPIVQCAPGTGQPNSAAASLRVNGVGYPGANGPFLVTIPTTGPAAYSVTFSWSGPPNAPLILATGSPQTNAAMLSCVGSLDLSLANLTIVGDFFTSPFPLNYQFILNGSGTAETTFSVPASVLGAPWVSLQGAVASATCGSIPYKLTAAFTIQ